MCTSDVRAAVLLTKEKWRIGKKRKTKSPLFRPAHKTCQETNCWKNGSKVNRKSGPMAHNNDFPVVKAASLQPLPILPNFCHRSFLLLKFRSKHQVLFQEPINEGWWIISSNSFTRARLIASSGARHQLLVGDILQNLLICDISLIRGKGRGWTEVKGGISSITILLICKFLKRVRNLLGHHELCIKTIRSKVCGFWKGKMGI